MIRVLRVLEYEYPDHVTYERDNANWTQVVDRNHMQMHSTVVRVQEVPDRPISNPTEHDEKDPK